MLHAEQRSFANGQFTTIDILGEGGAGVVYLALDTHTMRHVALKVPHPHLVRHRKILTRFKNEGRIGAMLNHPMLATVYQFERANGYPYIAMELVEGRSLEDCMVHEPVPPRAACKIMLDLATALGAMHNHPRRIVHRDVKPANVFLRFDGFLKLTDFGIAKILQSGGAKTMIAEGLTQERSIIGTHGYMGEAQAHGEEIDEQADMFALGVTFWVALTRPARDDASAKTWKKWKVDSVDHSSLDRVPEVLRPILVECFQGRLSSMEAFSVALLMVMDKLPTDGSEAFWTSLREEAHRNHTQVPVGVDSFDGVDDNDLSSEVEVPPSELLLGEDAERHAANNEDDDEEEDGDDDVVPAKVTGTDPAVRRSRRNKRYMRTAVTTLAAAVALIAVTYAITLKSSLSASTVVASSTPVVVASTPSAPTMTDVTLPITSGAVQTTTPVDQPPAAPVPKKETKAAAVSKKVDPPAPTRVSEPPPIVKATELPISSEGTVKVFGKPTAARLLGEHGVFTIPGKVPAGTYTVEAKFQGDDSFRSFNKVEVKSGGTLTVRCDADFTTCQ